MLLLIAVWLYAVCGGVTDCCVLLGLCCGLVIVLWFIWCIWWGAFGFDFGLLVAVFDRGVWFDCNLVGGSCLVWLVCLLLMLVGLCLIGLFSLTIALCAGLMCYFVRCCCSCGILLFDDCVLCVVVVLRAVGVTLCSLVASCLVCAGLRRLLWCFGLVV